MAASRTKNQERLKVETTVMAIREKVMSYFKGTCVDTLTVNSNIHLREIRLSSNYQYQRREAENRVPKVLTIGNVPILRLEKAPDTITFQTGTLKRSKQLREVQRQLEAFAKQYLIAIERKYSDEPIIYR